MRRVRVTWRATSSPAGPVDEEAPRSLGGRLHDPSQPVFVISVAANIVRAHPRTLRIYEDEGLLCPARTPTNIRLYSERDIRRIQWIRHLTQDLGVNLAGVRVLFELEEKLGTPILEALFNEMPASDDDLDDAPDPAADAHKKARSRP